MFFKNEELISGENWLGSNVRYLLKKYFAFTNLVANPCVVEVGSWKGRSSIFLLQEILTSSKLHCVDTWQGSVEHSKTQTQNLFDEFESNLKKFNLFERCIPINPPAGNQLQRAVQFSRQADKAERLAGLHRRTRTVNLAIEAVEVAPFVRAQVYPQAYAAAAPRNYRVDPFTAAETTRVLAKSL